MDLASTPTLKVEGVRKSFRGLRVLSDVHLELAAGERRVLIGPNGAGKTTLFNIITGLVPADSGRVFLLGKEVTRLPAYRRTALGLARTFQITALFQNLPLWRNVVLALLGGAGTKFSMLRPLSSYTYLIQKADELLDQWDMLDKRNVPVRMLSYGEQRQVEILLALAQHPKILLLDEPTAGLSPAETVRVVKLIDTLPRDLSMLIIEHDMDVAFQLADSLSVLHLGMMILTGDQHTIRSDERVRAIYLGAIAEKLARDA
ncbi:MAG TPA: ABC transporter ATP-binding protein [Chloroflexota bacterium]|nr:ABC transporter ATP-binding protein [Chloroflexota bacterium]